MRVSHSKAVPGKAWQCQSLHLTVEIDSPPPRGGALLAQNRTRPSRTWEGYPGPAWLQEPAEVAEASNAELHDPHILDGLVRPMDT